MRRAFAIALAVSVAAGCEGRAQHAATTPKAPRSGPKVVVLDLTGGVPEREESSLFGPSGRRRSLETFLSVTGALKKDNDAKGVLVKLGSAEVGLARAQEIAGALERVRREQKLPVHCHADALSNATAYLVARGCTKVWVSPAGEVATVGIAAQIVYLRKLLADELHISVDILQVGKFKGAEEPLTRDGPSDEARASLEGVLGDLRHVWLDGIKAGRGRAEVATAAEDGPYSPWAAKDRGLIDEVGYADDATEDLKKVSGAVREETRFGSGTEEGGGGGLDDLLKALAGGGEAGGQTVGLIRASGSISMGGGDGLFGDGGITERELGRQIGIAEKSETIKAVVLRIDSPGGSALASDLLWHQLMALRKKKPLVVSVGEMAASGGYYLASTANEIFADSSSIVGSIGVVGGKVGIGDALERYGVHAETFPANKDDPNAKYRAAYSSLLVSWDKPTRERVYDTMVGVYDLFLRRVAEGRGTTVEKIAPSAEGRIFAGDEALKRGLVDHLDGLTAALRRARELGKLPEGAHVTVLSSRPRLLDVLGIEDEGGDAESSTSSALARTASAATMLPGLAPSSPGFVALGQLAPELLPFAQSFVPLARGERALVVLPYALSVR